MLFFAVFTVYTAICFFARGWVQYLCMTLYWFLMLWAVIAVAGPYYGGRKARYNKGEEARRWAEEQDTVGPTPARFTRYLAVTIILFMLAVAGCIPLFPAVEYGYFPSWGLFGIFYALSIFLFCLYQPLEFLMIRLHTYRKLQKVCAKNGYRLTGSVRAFLVSDRKNTSGKELPCLSIETPEGILRVLVLGRPGIPMRYTFHKGKDSAAAGYTVLPTGPYEKTMMENPYEYYAAEDAVSDDPKERRRTGKRKLYSFPPVESEAAGRTGKSTPCANILLFCPEGACCEDLATRKTVAVGGELYGYTVYNARRFLRGRLGSRGSET